MGTNYVESSLKRFLKRKVKVTLGLVVAFMITGTVSFGIEFSDITNEEHIFGMGDQKEFVIDENFKIDKTGSVKIKYDNGEEIKVAGGIIAVNGAVIKNYATLGFYNDKNESKGSVSIMDSKFYNYGEIVGANMGNSTLYNYGNVKVEVGKNKRSSAIFFNKNDNGEIQNFNFISGGDCVITFGIKANTFTPTEGNNIKNYGLIYSYKDYPIYGEEKAEKNYVYNNGVIGSNRHVFRRNENFSVISNGIIFSHNNTNSNSDINNYNLYTINDNNKIRGAVLRKEQHGNKFMLINNGSGIIDDTQYENDEYLKYGTVKDISTETEMNNNTIAGADNLFINNASLKLDLGTDLPDGKGKEISNKAITAVYQGGASGNDKGIVLDNTKGGNISGNNHLTLDNTTIIGYFEKDGTLLKIDGDLILKNGSIINAVAARDEDGNILKDAENVIAVDVAGKLIYTAGESNIYGTIKGGEKSHIIVNGEENKTNDLNEILETSGEVDLLNGDWTKGTGKITLDGTNAVVNIDKGNGNLTGYLYGDNSSVKTTLDGMIEGNGTLNVNKIKFDMGNLQIDSLNDIYTVDGNGDVTLEGVSSNQDVLNKIEISGIFNKKLTAEGDIVLSFKSAAEMGIHNEEDAAKYEELIKNFKDDKEKYDIINKGDAYEIRKYLGVIDAVMELLGTTGVKITRDLTGAFTSAVNEWGKKADKGEWLTNAKYIGSDMEYDGTETINGYDSDINSMIGMAEYGITENTSVGFAVGGGDTKIDLKHSEKKSTSFDGNNYYAGVYAKHSVNGFDMVGSLGYTVSELDVDNGGSADSTAFTLGGYIKKDVKLSDTIKLQPNLSFTYDYVMQDTAEMGEGMTIDDGDYHIFEGGAGVNLVKEFAFEKGNLELSAGIKYVMTNIERNKDVTGKFYDAEVNLGDPDIDDTKGTAHIGFDFEHTTGFGVNGKYETMWSDSGDDSRITAGISYRF